MTIWTWTWNLSCKYLWVVGFILRVNWFWQSTVKWYCPDLISLLTTVRLIVAGLISVWFYFIRFVFFPLQAIFLVKYFFIRAIFALGWQDSLFGCVLLNPHSFYVIFVRLFFPFIQYPTICVIFIFTWVITWLVFNWIIYLWDWGFFNGFRFTLFWRGRWFIVFVGFCLITFFTWFFFNCFFVWRGDFDVIVWGWVKVIWCYFWVIGFVFIGVIVFAVVIWVSV